MALPFGFYQSWEAQFIISEAIEEVDRGSYDLLVRPGTTTDRETHLKMVDLSYATHHTTFNGWGIPKIHYGFTREEWKTIANDPRVEISAPIATLGFIDSITQNLVLPKSEVAGDYRYQVEFYTTDGLIEYSLSIANKVFKEEVELKWQLPTTSHLLVGIDPESEQKLTGIDFQSLLEPAQEKKTFELAGSDKIKVMQRQGLTTPLKVRIVLESLEDNLVSTLFEGELTDYFQPFSGGDIQFLEDGSLEVLPPS